MSSTYPVIARDNTETTGAGAPIDWLRGTKDADDFYDGSWDWYLLPQLSVTWFEAAGLYDGLGPLEGNGVLVACRGEAVYGVADLDPH